MDLLDGESLIWSGRPSWRAMVAFYIRWGLLSLVPLAVVIIADGPLGRDWSYTWFVLITIVALVLVFAIGWVMRIGTHYAITDRRILIRRGILSRRENSTHIDRVQNINTRQTPMQRVLGVGSIDFDTAGTDESDSEFVFAGIVDPNGLRRRIDTEYRRRME